MAELYQFEEVRRKEYEAMALPCAIYQYADGKVHVLIVSDGLCKLVKRSREELMEILQNDMYAQVHPQDVYAIVQAAQRFATEDSAYNVIYRERLGDDKEYSTLHTVGEHVEAPDGTRLALVRYDNITAALEATQQTKKVFASAVEQFYETDPHAVCIISQADSRVLYTNTAYGEVVPPQKGYDIGVNYWEYFHGKNLPERKDFFREHSDKGQFISEAVTSGEPLAVNIRKAQWAGEDAFVIEAEALEDVYIDSVTGLTNAAYVDLKAEAWIRKFASRGKTPVLLFFDVMGMKMYNAQYGYKKGDELLRDLANVLKSVFGRQLISRVDADHFCVLTEDTGIEELVTEAHEQMLHVGAAKTEVKAGIRRINSEEQMDTAVLMDEAKLACETIRKSPDVILRFYDEELEKQLQDQKFVNDHIDAAIANGEIKVYYQPVVRTLNHKLCGYEALARWISPELGFLAPYRFIPALEASHQIHKLDCFIIEEVCRQYHEDVQAGREVVPVSFNLSRLDFQMCDIFGFIREVAGKYQVPPSAMHIEITETTFSEDDGQIRSAIDQFHEAGYEVWMDDFGSGYSSLNSLKDYSFDQLKIDMEFLRSFSDRSKKIITSIVQMAKSIGIHTLAEGVENDEHYEFLRSIGCEKVQGYYFGKPLPLRESLAQVVEKDVTEENETDAVFYSAAGIEFVATEDPFAVVEYNGREAQYLYMNQDYLKVLQLAGLETPEQIMETMNGGALSQDDRYRERLLQAVENGGELHFAMPLKGNYLTITIQILNKEGERICFKQTLSNAIIEAPTDPEGTTLAAMGKEKTEEEKETILIADDEPINFMMLSAMLRDHYNILYAENGEQALQQVKDNKEKIAAILLDMVMPVMNGMDVLKALRQDPVTRFTPVLVMTSATEMQESVLLEGASQFLPKPYEKPEIILAKIRNEIAKSAVIRGYSFRSMEHMPGGLVVYRSGSNQEILFANQRTLEIYECETMEEFMALTRGSFKGMVHPEDYPRIEEEIKYQIGELKVQRDHVRYRIKTKTGNITIIDEFGQLVRDEVYGSVFYVFIGETINVGDFLNGLK